MWLCMVDVLLPLIGFMATGFAVASSIPQIRKATRTKKSDDLSIRFIIVLIMILRIIIKLTTQLEFPGTTGANWCRA